MALRALVSFVWFAVHLIPLLLLFDPANFKMANGTSNFLLGITLCFMLPAFLIGFNAFAFLRLLFFKLKLDNTDAVGKEFISRNLLIEQEERAMAEQEELEL